MRILLGLYQTQWLDVCRRGWAYKCVSVSISLCGALHSCTKCGFGSPTASCNALVSTGGPMLLSIGEVGPLGYGTEQFLLCECFVLSTMLRQYFSLLSLRCSLRCYSSGMESWPRMLPAITDNLSPTTLYGPQSQCPTFFIP